MPQSVYTGDNQHCVLSGDRTVRVHWLNSIDASSSILCQCVFGEIADKKQGNTMNWVADAIAQACRSENFCANGNLPALEIGLTVAGVGEVPLPLMPKFAKQLIAVGRTAPYGKGMKTLVDKKVRNSVELDASCSTSVQNGYRQSIRRCDRWPNNSACPKTS